LAIENFAVAESDLHHVSLDVQKLQNEWTLRCSLAITSCLYAT